MDKITLTRIVSQADYDLQKASKPVVGKIGYARYPDIVRIEEQAEPPEDFADGQNYFFWADWQAVLAGGRTIGDFHSIHPSGTYHNGIKFTATATEIELPLLDHLQTTTQAVETATSMNAPDRRAIAHSVEMALILNTTWAENIVQIESDFNDAAKAYAGKLQAQLSGLAAADHTAFINAITTRGEDYASVKQDTSDELWVARHHDIALCMHAEIALEITKNLGAHGGRLDPEKIMAVATTLRDKFYEIDSTSGKMTPVLADGGSETYDDHHDRFTDYVESISLVTTTPAAREWDAETWDLAILAAVLAN